MRRLVDRLGERVRVAGRRRHDDERAGSLDRDRVPAHRRSERAQPVAVRGARRRVDEPTTRRAHLHETEVGDVARDRRLDDVEAGLPERGRDLGLRRERALAHELEDRVLSLPPVHSMRKASTICGPRIVERLVAPRPHSTVSGGARRTTCSPAVRTRSPARGTRRRHPPRASDLDAEQQPTPAHARRRPGDPGAPSVSSALLARTPAEQLVVDRSTTAHAAAHETGFPPKVEPWSPGANAAGRRHRRRAARRSGGRSRGPSRASRDRAARRAARRRRTTRCARPRSEPRRSQRRGGKRRRRRDELASSGMTPPSPRIGSSRIRPTSSSTAAIERIDVVRRRRSARRGRAGANGSRFADCPVAESAPSVLPWKPPSSATTPDRPVALRAYFSAASIASAPELQKNACAPPKRSESSDASCSAGSVR